ncbi:Chromosome partition protein Smc [Methylobacterium crusticola]|uniref:Chromosome partition protein Smc n=2 Tax=Methylobacterium crusticola TaxID=1697972 RepID=A0ABQ4QWJ7_9HYPH|nr:Chromosome partition protein Smc [Methylobacterium crusticola]
MFLALGCLVAALCALLILPALNARAERLARRRLEALYPMSIAELTAEKDHLRAEFAVLQRQLERKVEEARSGKQAEMEELGRRAVRIGALTGEMERRDGRIAELERDLAETRGALTAAQGDLAELRLARAAAEEALRALEGPHQRALADLAALRVELETTARARAEAETGRGVAEEALRAARERLATAGESVAGAARDQIQALEDALADLNARHAAVESELTALRPAHAAALAALAGSRQALEPGEAGRTGERLLAENAALQRRIAEVADALMAQGRAGAAEEPRTEPRLPPAAPFPTSASVGTPG